MIYTLSMYYIHVIKQKVQLKQITNSGSIIPYISN